MEKLFEVRHYNIDGTSSFRIDFIPAVSEKDAEEKYFIKNPNTKDKNFHYFVEVGERQAKELRQTILDLEVSISDEFIRKQKETLKKYKKYMKIYQES